jgi:hypothetical protein
VTRRQPPRTRRARRADRVALRSLFAAVAVFGAVACAEERPAESPPAPAPSSGATVAIDTASAPVPQSSGAPAIATPGESPQVAPASSSSATGTAGGPPATAAAPSPASQAPLSALFAGDSASVQRLVDDATRAPAATLRTNGATADDPLVQGLRDTAKKTAPGMQAEGPLAIGVLREKSTLQTDITLSPGKCYAIIGYSKKVRDLDLYLLLSPGILSAQDTTDDNAPSIGGEKRPMCPVATTPITYKLSIVAEEGAGEVAVQLYAKSK